MESGPQACTHTSVVRVEAGHPRCGAKEMYNKYMMNINLRGALIGIAISLGILAVPVIYFYTLMPQGFLTSCDREGQKMAVESRLELKWKQLTNQPTMSMFGPKCGTVDDPSDMGPVSGGTNSACEQCTGKVEEQNNRKVCYGTAYACWGI